MSLPYSAGEIVEDSMDNSTPRPSSPVNRRPSLESLSGAGRAARWSNSSLYHPEAIPLPISPSNSSLLTEQLSTRRSSLDRRPNHDQQARNSVTSFPDPENIPLPSSSSSEWVSTSSSKLAQKSSLDILLAWDQYRAVDVPFPTDASNIPLPPSSFQSSQHGIDNQLEQQHHSIFIHRERSPSSYMRRVGYLSDHLPHLRSILHPHRSNSGRLDILDYTARSSVPHTTRSWNTSQAGSLEGLSNCLAEDIPADITSRLILVEDLNQDLIARLGYYLGISPQCFAEHLHNSGYQNGQYNEPAPRLWSTSALQKDYVSVHWYRPMTCSISPAAYSRPDLLESGISLKAHVNARSDDGDRVQSPIEYVRRATTNILRSDWHVGTEPETTSKDSPFALEERATVWVKQVNGCHIVVVLTDPLPEVIDTIENLDSVRLVGNSAHIESWELVRRPRQGSNSDQTQQQSKREVDQLQTQDNGVRHIPRRLHQFIMPLTSRLTTRRKVQGTEPETGHAGIQDNTNLGQVSGRDERSSEPSGWNGKFTRKRYLFREIMPRGPLIGSNDILTHKQLISCYQDFLTTHSTSSSCKRWLQQWSEQPLGLCGPMTPLWFIFGIIHHDTMSFLQRMDLALMEISNHTLDSVLIEERLAHWRSLISRFQLALPQLEASVRDLADFLFRYEDEQNRQQNQTCMRGHATLDLQSSLSLRMSDLKKQADKTNKSLVANLSIFESRRGIAEAESVGKLTELAFLFLPLTFSASVFSMQVKELGSGVPIATFVVVAGILTISSYGLRLLTRSRTSRRFKRFCLTRVRADARLRPDARIPTFAYLRFFMVSLPKKMLLLSLRKLDMRPLLLISLMSVVVAAPLAILWTQGLPSSTKAVLSVFLILIAVGFAHCALSCLRYYRSVYR